MGVAAADFVGSRAVVLELEGVQDVKIRGDGPGAGFEKVVGADRANVRDTAWHHQHVLVLVPGETGSVQAAAFLAGFGYQNGISQSGHQPVAGDKVLFKRHFPGCVFTDQSPATGE